MNLEFMTGMVFSTVENRDDEELRFVDENGNGFVFYHEQDCCESVTIAEIHGDLSDLVGVPIVVAEVRSEHNEDDSDWESSTWTFYEFRTIKGSVTVRWLGVSNGYYSESVNIARMKDGAILNSWSDWEWWERWGHY